MKVKIIRGTKQIGGCITEISVNNTKIIIDFGIDLENKEDLFELEGLTKGKSVYAGVFITHSHIDHIGLINKINKDIPVYVDKTSMDIYNLTCDFCNKKRINRAVNIFDIKENACNKIFNNSDIHVSAFISDHSAYNSCMFLVEGDGKKLLHTGDFRIHGRKRNVMINSLKKIGKVDLLITEGTNLTRCGKENVTENMLEEKVYQSIKNYNQVLFMQSSSNLDRTASVLRASIRNNKKFIMDLFSYHLQNIINKFINVDNKHVYVWKPYKYQTREKWFKDKYVNIDNNIDGVFPFFTMEVKESMLVDIKMLYQKGLLKKTCLIYSMWNGYIEKNKKLTSFLKALRQMNIDIIYLHTSGHADEKAFKLINAIVNPQYTIIIHTENGFMGKELFNNVIWMKDNEYVII